MSLYIFQKKREVPTERILIKAPDSNMAIEQAEKILQTPFEGLFWFEVNENDELEENYRNLIKKLNNFDFEKDANQNNRGN